MIKDIEKVVLTITDEIKKFTDIAVIGLSGGADSTLVSTLCTMALGKENVYGYGLPYGIKDKNTFNKRSANLARILDINYKEFDIKDTVDIATQSIDQKVISPLNFGNMKARIRTNFLYSLNQQISEEKNKRCRVIGTGNLSEDFIGYDTKGGDALADIFPIGELFKSEVYQFLNYFVEKGILVDDLIDHTPSAGLWEGQTDEDELGYTYNEMEPAIIYCLEHYSTMYDIIKTSQSEVTKFVWKRHISNKHKHMTPYIVMLGDATK